MENIIHQTLGWAVWRVPVRWVSLARSPHSHSPLPLGLDLLSLAAH